MEIETNAHSDNELWRRFHKREKMMIETEDKGRFYNLRQILNIIFILMSIAGIMMWFYGLRDTGIYILIIGSIFKFSELSLRIIKL